MASGEEIPVFAVMESTVYQHRLDIQDERWTGKLTKNKVEIS